MELPKGTNKSIDCPVVREYRNRRTLKEPSTSVRRYTDVKYTPVVTLKQLQDTYIAMAVVFHNGNLAEAARSLGIGRATLYKKYKKL